jgi:hypothetical protein
VNDRITCSKTIDPRGDSLARREFLKRASMVAMGLTIPAGYSAAVSTATPGQLSAVERFNYGVGTQTIGASYQFTKQPRLIETAHAIREMGPSVIKLKLNHAEGGQFKSLRDVAANDPVIKQIFTMPFGHYHLWAYPFNPKTENQEESGHNVELYDLCCYLLREYRGTGKAFYLGHWEGDWELRGEGNKKDPTAEAISWKIRWLNARQKAVDDAKRDTASSDVEVYCYAEANLVRDAMKGRPAMVNAVVPHTNIDFVSYSSYDTTNEHTAELGEVLDFIETKLPVKPAIKGKRVWIGEYGFAAKYFSPQQQNEKSREVMKAALRWGCPFVLYWEMYNNEVKDNKQAGYWLIDDKNVKQPAYYTHQRLCEFGRQFVADRIKSTKHPPSFDEYRQAAVTFLETRPN